MSNNKRLNVKHITDLRDQFYNQMTIAPSEMVLSPKHFKDLMDLNNEIEKINKKRKLFENTKVGKILESISE